MIIDSIHGRRRGCYRRHREVNMQRWTLASVIGALGLGACTSMLYPDRLQTVAVNSQPPGASVQVNGTALGTTPVHVQLDRRQSYTVELQKGGYDPYRQVLTKSVDPLFFLNAL